MEIGGCSFTSRRSYDLCEKLKSPEFIRMISVVSGCIADGSHLIRWRRAGSVSSRRVRAIRRENESLKAEVAVTLAQSVR
jgi:hypothetical protein